MAYPLDLPTHSDSRGNLTVIEKILPFEIKRIYYMYGCTGIRGGHRHRKTVQALVCVHGSCVVDWDNGTKSGTAVLGDPARLLTVLPEDWHIIRDFSPDSALLVLASETYNASDYIYKGYTRD